MDSWNVRSLFFSFFFYGLQHFRDVPIFPGTSVYNQNVLHEIVNDKFVIFQK